MIHPIHHIIRGIDVIEITAVCLAPLNIKGAIQINAPILPDVRLNVGNESVIRQDRIMCEFHKSYLVACKVCFGKEKASAEAKAFFEALQVSKTCAPEGIEGNVDIKRFLARLKDRFARLEGERFKDGRRIRFFHFFLRVDY